MLALALVVHFAAPTAAQWSATGEALATLNAQVTSRTVDGAVSAFSWDADGRLVTATLAAASGAQASLQFEYDGLGLRRKATGQQLLATGVPVLSSRTWAWGGESGDEAVAEGTALTTQVAGFPLGEGGVRFGHDALGSVVAESQAAGTVTAAYGVWGGRLASSAPLATSQGFAGLREEDALSLEYAETRWYDSRAGAFLSLDDVGSEGRLASPNALGPWAYANRSPLSFTDTDGRDGLIGNWKATKACNDIFPESPLSRAQCLKAHAVTASGVYGEYREGMQDTGAAIHAGFEWMANKQGATSNQNYAWLKPWGGAGVAGFIQTGSNGISSYNNAVLEFVAQIPVGIAGIGLLPEALWHSPGEFGAGFSRARQGFTLGNFEDFAMGSARMSGSVGLWAGVAAGGLSFMKARVVPSVEVEGALDSMAAEEAAAVRASTRSWSQAADPSGFGDYYREQLGVDDVGGMGVASEPGAEIGQTEAVSGTSNPGLDLQRQLSELTNRQGAVVDRWLQKSSNRWASLYRARAITQPNFAKGIRGRILDVRMKRTFKSLFGKTPGARINRTIPGSGNALRPDLYLPNVEGRSVIYDVGGPSKIQDISKYNGMADDVVPLVPVQWMP